MKKFYFETSKPHESPLVRMPPKRNISVAKFLQTLLLLVNPAEKHEKKPYFTDSTCDFYHSLCF